MLTVLRFLFRVFGCCFLAGAIVLLVADGSRSIAQSQVSAVSAVEFWQSISPQGWEWFIQALHDPSVSAFWQVVFSSLLSWPVWVISGVLGIMFMWLGQSRQKRPRVLAI